MAVATGLAIAGISLQALGMISDFIGGSKGSKAAKKAARAEGIAESAVTAERIRKLHKEERTMAGTTRAVAAGSGVTANIGTPELAIIAEQASEFAKERAITAQVGASKAAAAFQQGRQVGDSYKYRAASNIAQGASNIFSMMSQSGMFSSGGNNQDRGGMGPPT